MPVTVIEAGPSRCRAACATDARAVQLGFGAQEGQRATPSKAALGHAKEAGLEAAPRMLREFARRRREAPSRGRRRVTVDIFAAGERVKVTGTSKGRGFQGVVKRHGFGGGPNTHGNTKHRKPGSIGPGTDPSRVIKGKKMPGHKGDARHTRANLRVEKVDAERNLIYIRGAVAGPTQRHRRSSRSRARTWPT